jgi:cytochrome c peroxidase
MLSKKTLIFAALCAVTVIFAAFTGVSDKSASAQAAELTPMEQLGKLLFFDENLSEPAGQSCASCHDPSSGFADPDQSLPVSEGVIAGRFGNRNSPAAAYAAFFPEFDPRKTLGGQFWDGRAANLVEQAKGPFLNPVEMNNPDKQTVIAKIQASAYAFLFEQVFGPGAFNEIETAYHNMATAIAAYEQSDEVNRFTSKYDAYKFAGKAKCGHCHPDKTNSGPIVFTDFDYHNLGLPQNTEFPFNQSSPIPIDLGLGAITNNPKDNGKFKTPHLRNITLTAPYMHNGILKTLTEVVQFYNTRDIPGMWPPPEVPENLDSKFLVRLWLSWKPLRMDLLFRYDRETAKLKGPRLSRLSENSG